MLDRDLLEVLLPVLLETNFLLALRVKLRHDVVKTLLEARFELTIVVIAGPDDGFVVISVLYFNLTGEFILDFIAFWGLSGSWGASRFGEGRCSTTFSSRCVTISIGSKLLLKVYLENRGAKAWELSRGPLRQISIGIHGHQVLDILVLFLNDFITRQHYEMLLVNNSIIESDYGPSVV